MVGTIGAGKILTGAAGKILGGKAAGGLLGTLGGVVGRGGLGAGMKALGGGLLTKAGALLSSPLGLVAGAGAAGYGVGTFFEKKFDLANRINDFLGVPIAGEDPRDVRRQQRTRELEAIASAKVSRSVSQTIHAPITVTGTGGQSAEEIAEEVARSLNEQAREIEAGAYAD